MPLLLTPPRTGLVHNTTAGQRPAATWGVQLTGGSSNTLGSITQLIASTNIDADTIEVYLHSSRTSATITDALVNVYIGGSGSEVVLLPNLQAGWLMQTTSAMAPGLTYRLPVKVPLGSRISAAIQGVVASQTVYCLVTLANSGTASWSGSGVEAVGASTANSRGTVVTPGSTSEGSWTTLGTTVRAFRQVFVVVSGNQDTSAATRLVSVDIGTGSTLIPELENFTYQQDSSEYWTDMLTQPRWCSIPAGTVLQVRAQSSAAVVETVHVCLYGVY